MMMMMMILLLICLSILGDGCCWVVNLHSTGCLQKLSQQQASSSQSLLLLSKTQENKFPKTQILSLSFSLRDTDYSSLIHFQNTFKASEASPKHHNFSRQQKDYQQILQKLSLSLSLSLNSTQLNSQKQSVSTLLLPPLSLCLCLLSGQC
jgi:ADP-heptose:LPS heptosyltransferase